MRVRRLSRPPLLFALGLWSLHIRLIPLVFALRALARTLDPPPLPPSLEESRGAECGNRSQIKTRAGVVGTRAQVAPYLRYCLEWEIGFKQSNSIIILRPEQMENLPIVAEKREFHIRAYIFQPVTDMHRIGY